MTLLTVTSKGGSGADLAPPSTDLLPALSDTLLDGIYAGKEGEEDPQHLWRQSSETGEQQIGFS